MMYDDIDNNGSDFFFFTNQDNQDQKSPLDLLYQNPQSLQYQENINNNMTPNEYICNQKSKEQLFDSFHKESFHQNKDCNPNFYNLIKDYEHPNFIDNNSLNYSNIKEGDENSDNILKNWQFISINNPKPKKDNFMKHKYTVKIKNEESKDKDKNKDEVKSKKEVGKKANNNNNKDQNQIKFKKEEAKKSIKNKIIKSALKRLHKLIKKYLPKEFNRRENKIHTSTTKKITSKVTKKDDHFFWNLRFRNILSYGLEKLQGKNFKNINKILNYINDNNYHFGLKKIKNLLNMKPLSLIKLFVHSQEFEGFKKKKFNYF